jgi:valyl-tRNA synthetase
MEKKYKPSIYEKSIYNFWEKNNLLAPSHNNNPFTILMPPPNANASLHAGHGMYTIDDIMIRYWRILGKASLWVPGMDHAGFETQFVYEKHLRKQGKSRMDFDRDTLYKNIFKFVQENSGLIYQQFKQLGFLADWNRSVFTLDEHVLETVFETFRKMEKSGYIYRDEYIVNYCNYCGTSFSELEAKHIDRNDPLYYFRYGPLEFATVRPETVFADVALAVNPKDKRYKKYIGKKIKVDNLFWIKEIPVVEDEMVDREFGTGVVKITPAHDPNDFLVGKKNNLPLLQAINKEGRMTKLSGPYSGMNVRRARQEFLSDIEKGKYKNFLVKTDSKYNHAVSTCYKCNRDLEPTVIPNWYIKVEKLKKNTIKVIESDEVKFYPARYKKQILNWLENMRDWPSSRQIVWGIRIPAWYDIKKVPNLTVVFLNNNKESIKGKLSKLIHQYSLKEIETGLQELIAPVGSPYVVSKTKPGNNYLQETDTFDTWFSSGQWPLVTLREEEYKDRYPTDVLGTLADILPFWVSRMIMFSLYAKNKVPFKTVYLWSMVADKTGQKMSKSKGNVVNPISLVETYGADAFRAALLFGVSTGNRVSLSDDKVRAMRNFGNKIWNIGRFILLNANVTKSQKEAEVISSVNKHELIGKLETEFNVLDKDYHKSMKGYEFSMAFGIIYEFIWHRFADFYIEALKEEIKSGNIEVLKEVQQVYLNLLQMLHPFMPFITEVVYKEFKGVNATLLVKE